MPLSRNSGNIPGLQAINIMEGGQGKAAVMRDTATSASQKIPGAADSKLKREE
jgi:hypothetical protein